MDERDLTGEFEHHRPHLKSVAYRMLGSVSEAEDAVQESTGADRHAPRRRHRPRARGSARRLGGADAARRARTSGAGGTARLRPARHVRRSFDEIAPIVGRTPAAARQLASRARRRVQGETPAADADPAQRRELVEAFMAASRAGDFDALLAVLHPDVDQAKLRGLTVDA